MIHFLVRMLSNLLLFKLIMTPLIIASATLIARRWGERIGGLIVGLPLTSGPVSIFFALEQGPKFAASAAQGAMLGLIAVSAFCISYIQSAKRFPWSLSAVISTAFYLAAILAVSFVTPGLGATAMLIPVVLFAALLVVGRQSLADRPVPSPWWDLPLRMAIATTLLVLITTGAGYLGPKWSGLLSPFPIFTFVMATFSHSQGGPAAAGRLIRGVLTGLFSYTAFFLVVGLLIQRASLPVVYGMATLVALGINAMFLVALIWRGRLTGMGKSPAAENHLN